MTSRVEIDGLDELRRSLRKFEPDVAKELQAELRKVAKSVADDAKRDAPVATGKLRRSIRARSNRKGAAIAATAPHARITEFGGRHPVYGNHDVWVAQRARPFMRPAVEKHRPRVLREVERIIQQIARRHDL